MGYNSSTNHVQIHIDHALAQIHILYHGGGNAQVLKVLLEIQSEKDIAGWVEKRLAQGQKNMGMGHAVYRTMTPRWVFSTIGRSH